MSSIIKGGRIRSQSIVNLSERFSAYQIHYEKEEVQVETLDEEARSSAEEVVTQIEEEAQAILVTAKRQADEIMQEAMKQANEIVAEARNEAEALQISSEEEAKNRLLLAKEREEAIVAQAQEEAQAIKVVAQKEKEELIASTEGELVEVLVSLLSYLVGEEVYQNTTWITCMVRRMLGERHFREQIKLQLAPTLYERLTTEEKEQLGSLHENIVVEAVNSLTDTICQIETREGTITYDVQKGLKDVIHEIQILNKLETR